MASEPAEFISNVKTSVQQLEELHQRLETEKQFQKLWETDSDKAFARLALILARAQHWPQFFLRIT